MSPPLALGGAPFSHSHVIKKKKKMVLKKNPTALASNKPVGGVGFTKRFAIK